MKKSIALLLFLCHSTISRCQTLEWAWVSGSTVSGQPGSFGSKGVADPSNVPSCRFGAATWTAKDGTLWLFGGAGNHSNDLWKYDPAINTWTWVSGDNASSSPGNYGPIGDPSPDFSPQGRMNPAFWTDLQGNFWLFGGSTYDFSRWLNDLWMFNPLTSEWTLVSGSNIPDQPAVYGTKGVPSRSNTPPAMSRMTCFTDHNGMFWLYGGSSPSGITNDLWRYNPGTGEWTWVNGSHLMAQNLNFPAVYGTKGVPAPDNTPGPRIDAAGWVDNNNNLWLFGASASFDYLNDLWKYDPETDLWTWISGSNNFNVIGNYGTKGVPAPTNVPSCRFGATSFPTNDGKLWMFGGIGMGTDPIVSHAYELNDLWSYDIASNTWTWMEGESTPDPLGVYGIKGLAAPGNEPGGRIWAAGWTGAYGRLWIFGGGERATQPGTFETKNDLWGFFPVAKIFLSSPSSTYCPGSSIGIPFTATGTFSPGQNFTAQLSDPTGSFQNPTNMATVPAASSGTISAPVPPDAPSGVNYRVRIIAFGAGVVSDDNGADIVIYGKPRLRLTAIGNTQNICPGTPVILTANAEGGKPPYQYQWSTGDNGTSINFISPADTTLRVTITDACSTTALDSARLTLLPERPVQLAGSPVLCPNGDVTLNAHSGYASYNWQDGSSDSTLVADKPGLYSVSVTDQCGKTFNGSIDVIPDAAPIGFLPRDTAICTYDDLTIAPNHGYNAYLWSTGETSRSITVSTAGIYVLQVLDKAGCTSADTIVVENKDCFMGLRIPAAFTPNGDGHNDRLRPRLFGRVVYLHFTVYSRLGGKVFETSDPAQGWDGNTPSGNKAAGAFIWTCEYQFTGDARHLEKGTVIVLR